MTTPRFSQSDLIALRPGLPQV